MSLARLSKYDRISFVLFISKVVCENPAMSNFGISQVKFDMHQLHWIIVKILYMKPKNWGRPNDIELYLIWDLLTEWGIYWITFIIERMIHWRDNPNRPLFYSSFMQMILEINVIVSKYEDLTKA